MLLEAVVLEHLDPGHQVADADRRLRLHREPAGRAHLLGDRGGDVGVALLVFGDDVLEQLDALLAGRRRERREGALRRGDGGVDIGLRAHRDRAGDGLGRRVDDVEPLRARRLDPRAVDVEFGVVAHPKDSRLRVGRTLAQRGG